MLKNTSRVEIIITISIIIVVIIISTRVVFLIIFFGNKSPKKRISNVRNGLKFGKICKTVILYTKM